MIKIKVAFWRAGFYPANQSNLKSFQKAKGYQNSNHIELSEQRLQEISIMKN